MSERTVTVRPLSAARRRRPLPIRLARACGAFLATMAPLIGRRVVKVVAFLVLVSLTTGIAIMVLGVPMAWAFETRGTVGLLMVSASIAAVTLGIVLQLDRNRLR